MKLLIDRATVWEVQQILHNGMTRVVLDTSTKTGLALFHCTNLRLPVDDCGETEKGTHVMILNYPTGAKLKQQLEDLQHEVIITEWPSIWIFFYKYIWKEAPELAPVAP